MPPDTPTIAPLRFNCLKTRSRTAFAMRSTSLAASIRRRSATGCEDFRIEFSLKSGLIQLSYQTKDERYVYPLGVRRDIRGFFMFIRDPPFTDLAGFRLRQRRPELNKLRPHEILKLRCAMTKHVLLRNLRARMNRENGLDCTAQNRVRHPDYSNFRYTFEPIDY